MSPSHRDTAENTAASFQGVGNLKVDKNMRIIDGMKEPMVEVLLRVLGGRSVQRRIRKQLKNFLNILRDKQTLGKWMI